ncbi:unnamed protein product [Dibothriocephalus latus]|uniref:Uncharacterized protein n=1 Tax=Dibothriocephalus latus TaxID=60516 RepID=A0A3P6QS11_DIBLA|nr:unnamed protein product [Dibothriocephalus latus]
MEKTDTTVWVGLIQMLKEKELLPVIAFCFSRARITNLVHALDSVDLLTKGAFQQFLFCNLLIFVFLFFVCPLSAGFLAQFGVKRCS